MSCILLISGLFESSQTPSDREDLVDPAEDQHPPTTTTMRSVYATNRVNTHASNELLFVVLGVVLGIMMLILCVVMVMCAFKQRQQRRLMGECLMPLVTFRVANDQLKICLSGDLEAVLAFP